MIVILIGSNGRKNIKNFSKVLLFINVVWHQLEENTKTNLWRTHSRYMLTTHEARKRIAKSIPLLQIIKSLVLTLLP